MTHASFRTDGIYTPDSLLAGNAHLLVSRRITVASGENLKRGCVLGKVTADGKYKASAAAASDGSQTPDLILAEDIDATSGDKTALAYARGDFAASALSFGTGHDAASVTEALRVKGITLLAAA